jgi:hypothetical protein
VLNVSPIINRYFNGVTGASWNNVTSWSEDVAGLTPATVIPTTTDTLIFSTANAVGPAVATTVDAALTIDSLVFTSTPTGITSFTVAPGTGGALTIYPGSSNNGIEVQADAGSIAISAPITATGVQAWTVDGTGANGSSLTLSGGVAFNAPVTKAGNGTLTLSGAGTGSGGLNFAAGSLNLGAANALGSGLFQLGSGVTVRNVAGSAIALAGANAMVWKQGFTVDGNNLSFGNGAVTLTENVTFNAASLALTGAATTAFTTVAPANDGRTVTLSDERHLGALDGHAGHRTEHPVLGTKVTSVVQRHDVPALGLAPPPRRRTRSSPPTRPTPSTASSRTAARASRSPRRARASSPSVASTPSVAPARPSTSRAAS